MLEQSTGMEQHGKLNSGGGVQMKNSCFGSKNLEASDLDRNTAIVHDFTQTQTNFKCNISILSPLAVVHPYTMREQIPTKQPGYTIWWVRV